MTDHELAADLQEIVNEEFEKRLMQKLSSTIGMPITESLISEMTRLIEQHVDDIYRNGMWFEDKYGIIERDDISVGPAPFDVVPRA